MNIDSRTRFQAAFDTAQAQVLSAVEDVEGIGPSLLGRSLTDIEVDDVAESADRALQSLREVLDALEAMSALVDSGAFDE